MFSSKKKKKKSKFWHIRTATAPEMAMLANNTQHSCQVGHQVAFLEDDSHGERL